MEVPVNDGVTVGDADLDGAKDAVGDGVTGGVWERLGVPVNEGVLEGLADLDGVKDAVADGVLD